MERRQSEESLVSDLASKSIMPCRTSSSGEHGEEKLRSLSRDTASPWHFIAKGAIDAALAIGPIFFFIMAGVCVGLHGRPISSYGEKVKAVTLLSPTVFPIVYAAILGKMLQRIGLYKAERGTTIGDLERLIGCQSFSTALGKQGDIRRLNKLGLTILLLWLLSPIGGQASLRLLSTEPLIINTNDTILYYPIELYARQTVLPLPRSHYDGVPFIGSLVTTALQSSAHSVSKPQDLFGRMKIPDINGLVPTTPVYSGNDWVLVQNASEASYTSIFGIPIAGVPESGNASFSIITHYWSVDCASEDESRNHQPWKLASLPNNTNVTSLDPMSPSFEIDVQDNDNSTDEVIRFNYLSRIKENITASGIISIECLTVPMIVESQALCQDGACSVYAMRKSRSTAATFHDMWLLVTPSDIFKSLSQNIPGVDISTKQRDQSRSELIERWILDPSLTSNARYFVDLSTLKPTTFARRLQMVLNTFWDATVSSNGLRTNSPTKESNEMIQSAWSKAQIHITRYDGPHYVCHFQFAGITMAISFVLLLAANLSLILGIVTRAPDALGFISVAARDNRYFGHYVPSHFDGQEATQVLRDVKVMIGDVEGDREVGHIALASMDKRPRRLEWGRMYD